MKDDPTEARDEHTIFGEMIAANLRKWTSQNKLLGMQYRAALAKVNLEFECKAIECYKKMNAPTVI